MAYGFTIRNINLEETIMWYINGNYVYDTYNWPLNISWDYNSNSNSWSTSSIDFDYSLEFSMYIPSWITATNNEDYGYTSNCTCSVNIRGQNMTVRIVPTSNSSGSVYINIAFKLINNTYNTYSTSLSIGNNYYNIKFVATYQTYGSVSFTPSTLDFGNVKINEPITKEITVTIRNSYTKSNYFYGLIGASNYDNNVFYITSHSIYNGIKSDQFTYNSTTYTTYTVALPIKFTPKYFGEQQYQIELSYYGCFNGDGTKYFYSKLIVKANVEPQTDTSVVTGSDGKIYLGNILLADSSNSLPIGAIIMFYGSTSNIPSGWALCDGKTHNGITTPNLTDRFIIGCSTNNPVGKNGGSINSTKDALIDSLNQNYFSKINLSHYHRINFQESSFKFGDNANKRPIVQTSTTPAWTGDYAVFNNVFTSYAWSNNSTSSGSRLSFGSDNPTKFPLPAFYALAFIMKIS